VAKTDKQRKEALEFIRADDNWEPVGHTPLPGMLDLRNWDYRLMRTWKPFYVPVDDKCNLCTYGTCDLKDGKTGSCGLTPQAFQARLTLMSCCRGLARFIAGARRLVNYAVDVKGVDTKIDLGEKIAIEAPCIRTVIGMKPVKIGDLMSVLTYLEHQLTLLLASTSTGMESSNLELESKALQAAMLSYVAIEVAEVAGMSAIGFPVGIIDTHMVDVGWASVDCSKPVILVAGNDTVSAISLVNHLRNSNLCGSIEIAGIGPVAHDLVRLTADARIVGPLSRLLFFLRCGIADVVLFGGGVLLTDIIKEAASSGTGLIATDARAISGLDDLSGEESEKIVNELQKSGAVLVLEPDKAAAVAAEYAICLSGRRNKKILDTEQVKSIAQKIKSRLNTESICPNGLPVDGAIEAAANGDFSLLAEVFEKCNGCGKCEIYTDNELPIIRMMQSKARREKGKMRVGRGPIMDTEIRKVGAPLVLGSIPGIIALVGGSNYPGSPDDIAEIAEEFARRKYIVVLAGDSAIAAALLKDDEGRTIYEKYPADFDSGCIVNLGSNFSVAHIAGAAIKIASIFAALPLRANYEVVADYILNRVGACGLAWGACGDEELALATGCNRLGIPVIVGPHCIKYGRLYLSSGSETDWSVMDGRQGIQVNTGEPSPEHLINLLGEKQAAMVAMAKLCMRKNDTPQGRAIKLTHYIGMHRQFYGKLPDDLHLFVRRLSDVPIFYKKEVQTKLNEYGWKEKPVVTLPTLIGTYPSEVSFSEVIH
jgi:acetyl-CoA decarbonylase/synthase complex subunit alpha